jgi:hypothetical protein
MDPSSCSTVHLSAVGPYAEGERRGDVDGLKMDDMYDAAWTRVRRASTFRDEAGACGCAVRIGGCAVHGAVNGAGGAGGRHCEGASPRLAARAAGSAAPASVGRAWNPIARTYSTLAKIIHTDHSYTHSVYGLYVEAPPLQNL